MGPTAGHDGDKVQLWDCFNDAAQHANQFWIPVEEPGGFEALYNALYQNKVLDADDAGGLSNGKHVQLWDYFSSNNTNQLWAFDAWYNGETSYLILSDRDFVLDATAQHIGDGDQVQIYQPLDGANQFWY